MCADQYGVKELKDLAEEFLLSRRRITFKNLPIRKLKEFYDIADAASSMILKKGILSLSLSLSLSHILTIILSAISYCCRCYICCKI